jgi:predicted RNA-binding Zn-ribbon protein involved in translation (DUF1610 family)
MTKFKCLECGFWNVRSAYGKVGSVDLKCPTCDLELGFDDLVIEGMPYADFQD